ncbi:glycosyltransferase [Lentzea sp. NPDC003310]|uniref:glycosyltransferase family 2 protein n=1 Tax=Lentzea sp. NPDC003310 TaxID=3154447 RepID=UPI0033AA69E7
MTKPVLSIVIPYKQRLQTLKPVLESLAEQTLDKAEFEVVLGVLEHDPELSALCQEFHGRIKLLSVHVQEDWNTSRATNLGLRATSGEIICLVDADVLLAPTALQTLVERYFQHRYNICAMGQVLGYEEIVPLEVGDVEVRPFEHYRELLEGLAPAERVKLDPRFSEEFKSAYARYPWAFARTGLMALPAQVVRDHELWLDEGFVAWGPEDQEWAYRISRSGTPLILADDVFGIHLPHRRDQAAQDVSASITNRYYLAKWPRLDLELALTFGGWLEVDKIYPEVERELEGVAPDGSLGLVRGKVDGVTTLVVGAVLDEQARPEEEVRELFDSRSDVEVIPLVGFAIPFEDGFFEQCRVLAPIGKLGDRYREAVLREAGRVSRRLDTV